VRLRGVGTILATALIAFVAVQGCGGSSDDEGEAGGSTATAQSADDLVATPVDVTELPLGDDMYKTDEPKRGYVYSCITDFSGGGAFAQGPWIDTENGTWNLKEKISVEGSVDWDFEFSDQVCTRLTPRFPRIPSSRASRAASGGRSGWR